MPHVNEATEALDSQDSLKVLPTITTSPESPSTPTVTDDELAGVVEMKLSDLIREGSELFPQTYNWGNGKTGGCALTAGYVAAQRAGYRVKVVDDASNV